jgi:hypothetical protein
MQERGTRDTDFVTLCHGEPWIGSIYFKFDKEEEENKSQQQRQQNSSQNDESQSDEKSASSSPQAEEETDSNQMVCFLITKYKYGEHLNTEQV